MRVPLQWLREYCDPGLDVAAIEERLTMTGTKVEAIHHHGVGELGSFVVGRVLQAAQHPDADRLRVCTVDVGADAPSTIVCGAPNVAAGQTVAVALPGAVMPDGTKLRKAKLRGVESAGMILAEDELALGSDHAGIIVLEGDHAPGTPLEQVLPIATAVLELEITPNRPDCLGVYGVARELHAATGAPLAPAPWTRDGAAASGDGVGDVLSVTVECPELAPRFTARVFEDVAVAPSPLWLKARLMSAGMRPISNVVDITNYVMLLTGQPLHAFDADRVAGGRLTVRRARQGEQVETLDGQTRTLDDQMVLIADDDGPTSIAGVMGGVRSEVGPETTRVVLEAACWDGPSIHRAAQLLALRSEASARFEKGLAPEQALEAQAVATALLIELCGARLRPGTIDAGPFASAPTAPAVVTLRTARTTALLGLDVAPERQAEILRALEFDVKPAAGGGALLVEVPHFRRGDVEREADLIEEIARIEGLEKLPATLPARRGAAGRLSTQQRARRHIADALAGRGMHEVVGWSFAEPALADRLRLATGDRRRDFVEIENPMSEAGSVLRTTLLGSLLDVAARNRARGNADVALFETGTVFYANGPGELPAERRMLAGLIAGRLVDSSWASSAVDAGFFGAKALLGAALDAIRAPWDVAAATEPFLHPGRAASVSVGGAVAGWIGELHPLVAEDADLERVAVFEVDLDVVIAAGDAHPRYEDVTSFPALRLDLAVALDDAVAAADVVASARAAGGPLLADVRVFDVFRGAQLGEGRKSLALALSFRAADRTLSDEEIAPLRQKIVDAIANQWKGELRA